MTDFTATRTYSYVSGAIIVADQNNTNENGVYNQFNASINGSTGHSHSGATGDGKKLNSAGLDLTATYPWTGSHTFIGGSIFAVDNDGTTASGTGATKSYSFGSTTTGSSNINIWSNVSTDIGASELSFCNANYSTTEKRGAVIQAVKSSTATRILFHTRLADVISPKMYLTASGQLAVGVDGETASGSGGTTFAHFGSSTAGTTGNVNFWGSRTTDVSVAEISFCNAAYGGAEKRLGVIQVVRGGADNTGKFIFQTALAGSVTSKMYLTASGILAIGNDGETSSGSGSTTQLQIGNQTSTGSGNINIWGNKTTNVGVSEISFCNYAIGAADKRLGYIQSIRDGADNTGRFEIGLNSAGTVASYLRLDTAKICPTTDQGLTLGGASNRFLTAYTGVINASQTVSLGVNVTALSLAFSNSGTGTVEMIDISTSDNDVNLFKISAGQLDAHAIGGVVGTLRINIAGTIRYIPVYA